MGESYPIVIEFEDGKTKSDQLQDGSTLAYLSPTELLDHFSKKYGKKAVSLKFTDSSVSQDEPIVPPEPYEKPGYQRGHRRGDDSDFI